jgi:hypothetical protein
VMYKSLKSLFSSWFVASKSKRACSSHTPFKLHPPFSRHGLADAQ